MALYFPRMLVLLSFTIFNLSTVFGLECYVCGARNLNFGGDAYSRTTTQKPTYGSAACKGSGYEVVDCKQFEAMEPELGSEYLCTSVISFGKQVKSCTAKSVMNLNPRTETEQSCFNKDSGQRWQRCHCGTDLCNGGDVHDASGASAVGTGLMPLVLIAIYYSF